MQYAKVGEYQRRGIIHFHALIRLDGPKTDQGFAPAPDLSADELADLVKEAVASVRFTTPLVDADHRPRVLAFGAQVDARQVRPTHRPDQPGEGLNAEQVAGYLAKYATKAATDNADQYGNTAHLRRIRETAAGPGRPGLGHTAATTDGTPEVMDAAPYARLRKWSSMLGFRGHFSTKSRRYSITLGRLRRARKRWQTIAARSRETGTPIDLATLEADLLADDDTETTLVIGDWEYLGSGWANEGDAALARAAAARAREYAQHKAQTRTQ